MPHLKLLSFNPILRRMNPSSQIMLYQPRRITINNNVDETKAYQKSRNISRPQARWEDCFREEGKGHGA